MTEEEELYINNNIDNYINIHNVKELEVKQEYHAVIDGLSVFSFTGEIKEEVKKYHEFYNDESGHEDPRFGVYKKNVNDNILVNIYIDLISINKSYNNIKIFNILIIIRPKINWYDAKPIKNRTKDLLEKEHTEEKTQLSDEATAYTLQLKTNYERKLRQEREVRWSSTL